MRSPYIWIQSPHFSMNSPYISIQTPLFTMKSHLRPVTVLGTRHRTKSNNTKHNMYISSFLYHCEDFDRTGLCIWVTELRVVMAVSLHVNTISPLLNEVPLLLHAISPLCDEVSLHLNTISPLLYEVSLHLNTNSPLCYEVSLHLNIIDCIEM
jgi:hypothetical protein